MYPEEMCAPMREDLTSVGFLSLRTPEEVSELLDKKEGTVLVMVNSVCGCAAGNARPAVKMSTQFNPKVDVFATVFAAMNLRLVFGEHGLCINVALCAHARQGHVTFTS